MNRYPMALLALLQLVLLGHALQDIRPTAGFMAGTIATLVWSAVLHPKIASNWSTASIAVAPGLCLAAFVAYIVNFTHVGSTAGLGFGFWWIISLVVQPFFWGVARTVLDMTDRPHA